MSPEHDPQRLVSGLRFTTSAATDERILANAAAAQQAVRDVSADRAEPGAWRTTVAGRWPALATAAAVILVAGLAIAFLERSTAAAYALEQTLEANRELRSFHARSESNTEHGWESTEIWMQMDEEGNLLRLRMELSHADGGPKVVVWAQNKARVWFKERNLAVVVSEPQMPAYLQDLLAQVDPNVTMEYLHKARAAGRIDVRTIEPDRADSPVQLVATFPDNPNWKDVYLIDPETKLVQKEESFSFQDDEYHLQRRTEYLEYNRPLAGDVFELDLPADVAVIDQTVQEIGLARGELTDEQVAVQIARQLFEALIDRDYARAGQLAEGLPADRVPQFMRELFGVDEFLRVVSIGQATRDFAYGETGFLCVPCAGPTAGPSAAHAGTDLPAAFRAPRRGARRSTIRRQP
ncbi:MAG: LolA family protein [Planctomycetota bacterium]|jgi:outer membrane lipoprotein-sorting protein